MMRTRTPRRASQRANTRPVGPPPPSLVSVSPETARHLQIQAGPAAELSLQSKTASTRGASSYFRRLFPVSLIFWKRGAHQRLRPARSNVQNDIDGRSAIFLGGRRLINE